MFHLLVKYDGWADGRDFLALERAFEFTDAELIPRSPDGALDFDRVLGAPALFTTEIRGKGAKYARVGTISRVRSQGSRIQIDYTFDGTIAPLAFSTLERLTRELSIDSVELSRTHWAIKNIDLFKVLLATQSALAPSPKAFHLDKTGINDTLLSVMMPFDLRFKDVYESIAAAAGRTGMTCLRADDIWRNEAIIQDIVSLICTSRIVVSDCTNRNANVFYETGIAHTLGRDVVLITQSEADVPFDLRHLRFIVYLDNGEGRQKLADQLEKRIRTLLADESRRAD
jgi:hypothetical protein